MAKKICCRCRSALQLIQSKQKVTIAPPTLRPRPLACTTLILMLRRRRRETSMLRPRARAKHHLLVGHVPAVARELGSLGMYSEQNIESLHVATNRLMRRYASIGSNKAKLESVLRARVMETHPETSAVPRKKRVCPSCGLNIARAHRAIEYCTCKKK